MVVVGFVCSANWVQWRSAVVVVGFVCSANGLLLGAVEERGGWSRFCLLCEWLVVGCSGGARSVLSVVRMACCWVQWRSAVVVVGFACSANGLLLGAVEERGGCRFCL